MDTVTRTGTGSHDAAGGSPGRLVELGRDACWDLLATASIGRLVWEGSEGLCAIPVNFTLGDERILVRTSAYSSVARECDDSPVAFQVDDLDPVTRTGWSVLARGRAALDFSHHDPALGPEVWPEGVRALGVRIDVRGLTGRRLLPG